MRAGVNKRISGPRRRRDSNRQQANKTRVTLPPTPTPLLHTAQRYRRANAASRQIASIATVDRVAKLRVKRPTTTTTTTETTPRHMGQGEKVATRQRPPCARTNPPPAQSSRHSQSRSGIERVAAPPIFRANSFAPRPDDSPQWRSARRLPRSPITRPDGKRERRRGRRLS
uniref:Uncharacterized protein n=1 Tax=Plectus sambesii TaxID=2011161 RepID=A0A914VQH0_9BILA